MTCTVYMRTHDLYSVCGVVCTRDLLLHGQILGIRMHSVPHAKSMHLRRGWPSCARSCQLITFLIVTDMYIRTYVLGNNDFSLMSQPPSHCHREAVSRDLLSSSLSVHLLSFQGVSISHSTGHVTCDADHLTPGDYSVVVAVEDTISGIRVSCSNIPTNKLITA